MFVPSWSNVTSKRRFERPARPYYYLRVRVRVRYSSGYARPTGKGHRKRPTTSGSSVGHFRGPAAAVPREITLMLRNTDITSARRRLNDNDERIPPNTPEYIAAVVIRGTIDVRYFGLF